MIALVAIALCLSLGLASGGEMRGLETISLRFELPVLGLFVVQGIARGRIAGTNASSLGFAVWVLSCVVLLVLLAPDWRRAGIWVVAIGLALNLLVVLFNGGMPVYVTTPGSIGAAASISRSMGFYQLAGPGTALALLGDVIHLGVGGFRAMLSPGDVLLAVGVVAVIISAMIGNADSDGLAHRG